MTALARLDDPSTSHEAAATVNVSATQDAVLRILRVAPFPYSDEVLVKVYHSVWDVLDMPPATPSSIRSRRAELTRKGLVVQSGYDVTDTGRRCRTWVAA